MNIPQTSYSEFPPVAYNGMVSEGEPYTKLSRSAAGAITVGTFVLMGTDEEGNGTGAPSPGQVKAIPDGTSSLATALGVACFDTARSPYSSAIATDSGSGQYNQYDTVPVLRKGYIWMWCENAVTAGDAVFVRCTGSGTSVNGQVRDGAATNFVQHPTAVFMSSTTGAGLALVEVK